MEHKQVPVSAVRGVDSADGIVEAIVSVTNIVDSVNDVIVPGAYAKTLKKRNPKGVWSHDTNIPVAKTLSVVELIPGDTRLPQDLQEKGAGALLVKMQFNLNTTRGRDAFHDVQFFADEQEWSIGYSVAEGKSKVEEKTGIRYINELELYEYSPVIFGAAPHTRTLGVKDDLLDIESSSIEMQDEKADYSDIDFSIPSGVKKQAEIGIKWSKEFNRGGTEVGKNTANYLLNNEKVTPSKARHIARYFPRHEVDLSTPSNSKPGADGYPGAGLIAWKLWGGDAGRTWSQKLVDAMNRRDEMKAEPNGLKTGDFVSWRSSGGAAYGRIERIERDGEINVPDSSFTITGTPEDPAALIRVYRKDGLDYSPTEVRVGHKFSTLKKMEDAKELVEHQDEMVEGLAEQQEMGLNPRQFTMYDLFEKMSEEFGKWDQSPLANGAHYFPEEKNPFAEEGIYCSNCAFYEGGQACHIVSGEIQPMGLCKLWVIKEQLITAQGAAEKQEEVEEVKDAGPNGKSIPSHKTAVDLNRAWDKTQPYKNMKSPADSSYYAKIFAYQNPNTTGDRKTHYNFIHHYVSADGTPGAASYSAMINSITVLNGGRSGTVLRGEARKSVYRHIASHYEDAGKPVPELKSDDFVDYVMMMKNIIDKPLTPVEGVEVKAAGRPIGSHTTAVSDRKRPLTRQNAILKVKSPASKAYYGKIFAYQMANTAGDMKTHYTFIHHFVSDDGVPGAAAMSELSVQMSVLNGARSGTKLRGEDRKAVWNHLAHHYRDFGKTPPELKSDQYIDNIMMQKGIITEPISDMESSHE